MAQNRTNKLYRQNVIRIIAFRKENKKMYSRVILIIFVFQIERFRVDALLRIHMQCGRWVFQNETFSHTTVSDVIERLKNREKRRTQDPLCINMFCFCLSNWFDILLCVCVRQHRRYAVDVRLFRTSSNVKRFFRLFTATAYYGSQIESKMCLHFDLRIVFKIFSRNLLAKLCPNEAEHFGYSHSIWCCDRIHFLFLSWIHSIAWLP